MFVEINPSELYGRKDAEGATPQLFIAPHQYIQGRGVLDELGRYLAPLLSGGVGVLITPGRREALGPRIFYSLSAAGLPATETIFSGECTLREVLRVTDFFRTAGVSGLIGVGGGKCLDTARLAASRLGIPVICVPTTASTDAPTAAHSMLYTEEGVFQRVEFAAKSPLLVLADVDVLAAAPARYLIAGMGDAFSTYIEARCCMENPLARTARGVRPARAALAIARQCRDLLLEYGTFAVEELRRGRPDLAVNNVVEANILLSGLGFESGGLAAAHAVAQGLTVVPQLHADFLHGELVAVGVMAHLLLERRMEEAQEAARFFSAVGLPVCLGDLNFDVTQRMAELDLIICAALDVFYIQNEPFEVTPDRLREALLLAGNYGRKNTRTS